MPTIILNKKDLLKLIGKKLSDQQLWDRISMLGTHVDSITTEEIIVELFPNRPDMLCSEGLSRALSSFIGLKTGLKKYAVKKGSFTAKVDQAKVKKVRPYAVAAIAKNIKLDEPTIESIMQLQEKIHETHGRKRKKVSIGVYDLDTIKFPLTYTTKPTNFKFAPLEMSQELTLLQILQRHPKGRDYAHLLEGFNEFPIWIDSKGQVLSMPPIINSEETRVTPQTKNLFIDVTGLDAVAVEQALNIIATAIAERGATIYEVKLGNKTCPNLKPSKMKLDINYVNKLLGLDLKQKDIKKFLGRMGFGLEGKNNVLIPCYRTDILHPIDLVEDVAIGYGYENFKPQIPQVATIGEEDSFEIFKKKIANILTGLELLEVSTYHLTNKEIQCKKMNCNISLIELANALTKDYNALRAWMVPSLLQVLSQNTHNEYPQKIFEMGKIFKPNPKTETGVEENTRLAVLRCHAKADYTKIKQIFDYLMRSLGLKYDVIETVLEKEHPSFILGRVARVVCGGRKVAYIGEIHPQVLANFNLEMPVAAFELNLTELFYTKK